jgi:hypothetical protein
MWILRGFFAVSLDALLYLGMRNGKHAVYEVREGVELGFGFSIVTRDHHMPHLLRNRRDWCDRLCVRYPQRIVCYDDPIFFANPSN